MAQEISYNTTIRNNRLKEISDPGGSTNGLDAGAGAGTLVFYDGTRPSNGGTATNEVATCTFSDPAATTVSAGVLTMAAITDDSSATGGTTTWARGQDSTATHVFDCNVSTSGADINLSNNVISAGQTVSITSFTITEGNNYP